VHEGDPISEPLQPLPRDAQCVLVAVKAHQMDPGEALEERLGVSAHSQGGVDEHCAVALKGGGEQLDAAIEEDGGVDVAQAHDVRGLCSPGPDPHPL